MEWHAIKEEQLLKQFKTSETGLTDNEAKKRLENYGLNEIKEVSKISSLKILLRQIKSNFIIYLLLIATIISFFVGKSVTAYTIIVIIFMVVVVGFIQEYRAEKAIKALKGMLVPISIVIRNGKEQEILSSNIVPGDILVLRNGEKIPADCLILEEKELFVNESILTGESKEIRKHAPKNFDEYSDENIIFMGTFIVNGKCTAKVIHTGMNTKFGKISKMISTIEKELPLQKKINKISKYMATVVIVISVLTGLIMLFRSSSWSNELFIGILILVIALSVSAFPEGFPVVLITTLASGAYRMAKQNAIVNRMSIIETLGETTVICSDKTGTITKGEMTIKKIFEDNREIEVSGGGYEIKGKFLYKGREIKIEKEPVLSLLLKSSVLCNDAKIERTGEDNIYRVIGNPTEASLLIMAAKAGIYKEDMRTERLEEIPFNSERKIMAVLCKTNDGNYVYSKGALEILIKKCKFIQREKGIFRITEIEKKRILKINQKMASDSFRTLALAYKKASSLKKDNFENDLIFLGIVGMEDPPREEIKESIKVCKKAGIEVKMITGDNKQTALAIANQIGLHGRIVEGSELDKMTDEELEENVNEVVIFARVKPEHKVRIVKALKNNGEIVTMTGDGVNDAPALKEAHIGVAMGKTGTDVSRSVADLTLKDDNFATIVLAVKEGRIIFKNIRKFVTYQLSCNCAELLILFFGVLLASFLGWQIPILLALQILFMNLITDNLPAITLGFNPPSGDVMEEKPRKKVEILNKKLITLLIFTGLLLTIFVLVSYLISFNFLGKSTEYSRTVALTSLICLEIVSAFNFRSFRKGVLNRSPFINIYLFYASLISIIATFLIIYSPLNKIFETLPLRMDGWLIAIFFSFLLISIFDFLKKLNNKKKFVNLEYI